MSLWNLIRTVGSRQPTKLTGVTKVLHQVCTRSDLCGHGTAISLPQCISPQPAGQGTDSRGSQVLGEQFGSELEMISGPELCQQLSSVSLAVDRLMIAQKISHTSPSLNHLRLFCVSASEKPLEVLSRRKEYRLHPTGTTLQRATQRGIGGTAVAREASVRPLASSACPSNFQSGRNLFLCLEKRSEHDETQTQ